MAQELSQIVLPLALALMMLVMGLSVTVDHFRRVLQQPALIVTGLLLQWLLLPLLAMVLVRVLALPAELALGVFILAACPGGATSNVISHLSGGDAALSVSLTALVSVLSPLTLPLSLAVMMDSASISVFSVELSYRSVVLPLLLVTALPLMLGMLVAHRWPRWTMRHALTANRFSFGLFLMLVMALGWSNAERLPQLGSLLTVACLGLCLLVMMCSALIGHAVFRQWPVTRTLAIEAGIQNAGTAIMISATLLNRPDLALVALFYGILMNLPAIVLIGYHQFATAGYTEAREY